MQPEQAWLRGQACQFTSLLIPAICSQLLWGPLFPLSWASVFCWAAHKGKVTWILETADGWLPLRPADTVIQPVGYCREVSWSLVFVMHGFSRGCTRFRPHLAGCFD